MGVAGGRCGLEYRLCCAVVLASGLASWQASRLLCLAAKCGAPTSMLPAGTGASCLCMKWRMRCPSLSGVSAATCAAAKSACGLCL